jgi:hypothetical protein
MEIISKLNPIQDTSLKPIDGQGKGKMERKERKKLNGMNSQKYSKHRVQKYERKV